MKRNQIIVAIVVIILILGIIIFGGKKSDVSTTDKPFKIGALLVTSGDWAPFGERTVRAMNMALEEYEAQNPGGRKVEIIYEDSQGDPKITLSAYQKLVSVDKVDAIIGPLAPVELSAIHPRIPADGVPTLALSPLLKDFRGAGANPIAIWTNPTLESETLADYVYREGVRSVGILSTHDDWEDEVEQAFEDRFKELGGTVVANEKEQPTASDVRSVVTKVINKNPEAIYLATYNKFLEFVKTARELGYTGKIYSIDIDTYFAEASAPYSDGLQFVTIDLYTKDFMEKFANRYNGEVVAAPAGQAYDAINLLFSFIKEGKDTREEILTELENLKQYEGVAGLVTFTDDHIAEFPLAIFEVQNGTFTRLDEEI